MYSSYITAIKSEKQINDAIGRLHPAANLDYSLSVRQRHLYQGLKETGNSGSDRGIWLTEQFPKSLEVYIDSGISLMP